MAAAPAEHDATNADEPAVKNISQTNDTRIEQGMNEEEVPTFLQILAVPQQDLFPLLSAVPRERVALPWGLRWMEQGIYKETKMETELWLAQQD